MENKVVDYKRHQSDRIENSNIAQLAWAVEYTYCISAEGQNPPNKCPRYDTKQSDGEALVIQELWGMHSIPSLPLLPGLI